MSVEYKMSSDQMLARKDIAELLNESNMSYIANNSSNLVVERTTKRQFADSQTYTNTDHNMVVNFQTGGDYISGRDSFLRLNLAVTVSAGTTNTWGFGRGSILNIIQTVKVISRSGVMLSYINKANLLQYYKMKYNYSREWLAREGGGLLGQADLDSRTQVYPPAASTDISPIMSTPIANSYAAATAYEFNIPLCLLSPFFDNPVLIPSGAARGMRIEITLAPINVALVSAVATSYTVSGVYAVLDSYRLENNAVLRLNEMSREKEGLVLQYYDWENSAFTKAEGVGNISVEMRKTVAMANDAFTVIRDSTNSTAAAKDSFVARPVATTDEMQYRVGSTYLPQTSIIGPKLWYANTLYCNNQIASMETKAIRYDEYLGASGTDTASLAILPVVLDRYWVSNSGLSINNSTTLLLTANVASAGVGVIDMFLRHTRRAQVFQENIAIMD
jgi:hypothetical protein